MRLGRGGEKIIHKNNKKLDISKIINVIKGSNVAILSTGAIFEEVYDSLDKLKKLKIEPSIYTVPQLKPIDSSTMKKIIKSYELITLLKNTMSLVA